MAVATKKKANSFVVGVNDETLREVLSAGKSDFLYLSVVLFVIVPLKHPEL